MTFEYQFFRPAITVDTVVFRELPFDEYEVLLIKRSGNPYQNMWALPGGYLEAEHERIHDAAFRELCEETNPWYQSKDSIAEYDSFQNGWNPIKQENLKFVGYFDDPERHPTDRVINFAFMVLVNNSTQFQAGDDAKELAWFPVLELPEMAFDHAKIIHKASHLVHRLYYT